MRTLRDWLRELRNRRVVAAVGLYAAVAWGGTEFLSFVMNAYGFPPWSLAMLASLLIAGFPVAMLLAWHFDLTLDGFRPTEPISAKGKSTILLAVLIFIGGSAGLFHVFAPNVAVDVAVTGANERVEAPQNSIAVLPFVNMSGDATQEYFSDGISEELLHRLAQVSELHVAARTSAFHFKNKNIAMADIAAQLGVRSVLEGSVRKAGNTIRVTAQLINASDGFHIWSMTYDRQSGDIFAIQDEIATQVVDALKVTLLGGEHARLNRHPTANLAAYDAYLLGRQKTVRRTSATLQQAVEHFSAAIRLDPGYALAYVGLADAYGLLGRYGALDNSEILANATPAVERALQLDDRLGEAYASLGKIRWLQRDLSGAEQAYKRALELTPNYARAYQDYGTLLKWGFARMEEAAAMNQMALVLDPLSTPNNMAVVEDYLEMGRFEEALSGCKRIIEIDPDYPRAYAVIADVYWEVFGQLDEGVRWLHKALDLDPGNPDHARWLGMIYLDLGDPVAGEHWMQETMRLAPTQLDSKWSAASLARYTRGPEEIAAVARALLEVSPGNRLALILLRNDDYRAGNIDAALQRFRKAYPDLVDGEDPQVNGTNWGIAIEVANVLIKVGERERADKLLHKALLAIGSAPRLGYKGFGISDAEVYALLGDKEKALSTLATAVQEGWRSQWWTNTEKNDNLASLHDEPLYQAIIGDIQSQMAEQLARVREWEANGELASIPKLSD
ncbi:MAG: tetratricopeptide repeat protein [Gammaproteobacteria bacterium]|nr:tetratricopeptide repeat protein [Gammaproteobacteria bacterium]